MSDAPKPYSSFYIQAWTVLSIVLSLILISMFLFGDTLLGVGQIVWSLLRWLGRPFI